MSGIYIPGMKMPPRGKVNLLVMFDDGMVQDNSDGQNQWRSIELPPHGRLIDADALIIVMEKCADALKPCTEKLCYNFAAAILREASPIIPADPEDMKGEKI